VFLLFLFRRADKVRFFFEPGALDETGVLRVEKQYAMNKIGHALAELDPVFRAFTIQPHVEQLVHEIGMKVKLSDR
jgi:hypothetical protein